MEKINQKLFGSSAAGGVDHSSAIFGSSVNQTGSTTQTLNTVAGTSSGSSATCLVSVSGGA